MRIVSLNAWGGAVFEPLVEWLPRSGADVLCLQEVTRTPGLGGWTHFEDDERTLPQRANLIAHLHGLRDPKGKDDTPSRRDQAERLVRLVTRVRTPDDLTVVCGDLNVLPESETFALLGAIGLTDLVGTADTRTSRYTKPVRHANYLLVSDPDAVKGFEILAGPEVSDHRPLVLDI